MSDDKKNFSDLSTEQLRAMAVRSDNGRASWSEWTREMLLAFFHNRYGTRLPDPEEVRL